MKTIYFFLSLFLIILFVSCESRKDNVFENYAWINEISHEHPRLFINGESLVNAKERALNDEKELFENMKNRVDKLIGQEIIFKDSLMQDGTNNGDHNYGTHAAESAFVYLVTEDEKYLNLTKNILKKLIEYYQFRNERNLNINWYAFSRINALAAYDWVYNDLTEEERTEYGQNLFEAISFMAVDQRQGMFRRNNGGIKTGFYGPPSLPWYTGIVFHKEGFNDSLTRAMLIKGYDDYNELLEYRSNAAGDDGGSASSVLGYCMGAYPWAEFNFFHTFKSATGHDVSQFWPYVPKFINYVFWNWLPGGREFGYGDARHTDNEIDLRMMHLHIAQMTHFYGDSQPDLIALGKWMQTKLEKERSSSFPYTRFLLNSYEEIQAESPSGDLPKARHFTNMGQIFLRSGSGPDDTYAIFSAGGILSQHRHFDNNNFVIYKKGYVTLDAGTRPQPGQHLSHYYCRTVAHNCITIKMPGEVLPDYWGSPALSEEKLPVPNDGGQNNQLGSEVIAFDENDYYIYIASDATDSYNKDKTNLVLRQFVFLPPDHFIVFDRVNSTQPDYQKRWLLHAAAEPHVNKNEFSTEHMEGRLFCKTLFPEKIEIKKIGGPGKQFWSDGRNWSLEVVSPDDWNYKNSRWLDDEHDLFGQWRIEVIPEEAKNDHIFLHLMQVGDTTLQSMADSESVRTDDMAGIRFAYAGKEYEVMFATKNEAGGKISISQGGKKMLEEVFSNKVKAQEGLY